MKIIIIIYLALIISSVGVSQSWKYQSGGNTFDGKYKTASIQGKGNDNPYTKPLLVINKFNESDLNFYISSSGYYNDADDVEVVFALNGDGENLYLATDLSLSDDGKTIFLSSFASNKEVLLNYEMINLLKSSSKLEVRIRDNYGRNDLKFSLSGSQKAINYVIPKKELDKKIIQFQNSKEQEKKEEKKELDKKNALELANLKEEQRLAQKEKDEIQNEIIKDSLLIANLFKNYLITENEKKALVSRIKITLGEVDISSVDSLSIKYDSEAFDKLFFDVTLFIKNKSKKQFIYNAVGRKKIMLKSENKTKEL